MRGSSVRPERLWFRWLIALSILASCLVAPDLGIARRPTDVGGRDPLDPAAARLAWLEGVAPSGQETSPSNEGESEGEESPAPERDDDRDDPTENRAPSEGPGLIERRCRIRSTLVESRTARSIVFDHDPARSAVARLDGRVPLRVKNCRWTC